MPGSLAKKLSIREGSKVLVLGAPSDAAEVLAPWPEGASVATKSSKAAFDVVLAFAKDTKALAKVAKDAVASLAPGALFWVAYPKKSSGVVTDISRDAGWDATKKEGFETVALVAIDETWSAARLRRSEDIGEPKGRANRVGAEKRVVKSKEGARVVEAPDDLKKAMRASNAARSRWEKLSFTHKKEYARWIEEAKKPDTRARRVEKTIEMLAEKK